MHQKLLKSVQVCKSFTIKVVTFSRHMQIPVNNADTTDS